MKVYMRPSGMRRKLGCLVVALLLASCLVQSSADVEQEYEEEDQHIMRSLEEDYFDPESDQEAASDQQLRDPDAEQNSLPAFVVMLDGTDFEHRTQASTGQTTGHWFVLFNGHTHNGAIMASKLWTELSTSPTKEVIFAEVDLDVPTNRGLAYRFLKLQPPCAVLFRDGKMYVYPFSLKADNAAQQVTAFWKGAYAETVAQEVPGEGRPKPKPLEKGEWSPLQKALFGLGLLIIGFLIRLRLAPSTIPGIEVIEQRVQAVRDMNARRLAKAQAEAEAKKARAEAAAGASGAAAGEAAAGSDGNKQD